MAKVPGTFDGTRYPDLRVLIPTPIKEHYLTRGTWDDIVKCRFYEYSQIVTVKIPGGWRKDKWQHSPRGFKPYWRIEDDEFIWD